MPDVRLTVDGALARITLDRPPLNVITISMLDALREAFVAAENDPTVRLIRLDAEGKAFSAGVDVADHVGERIEPMMHSLRAFFETLHGLEKPTLSVVQGVALGGGCEVTLATDLCYAADSAKFSQPEIRLGLFAPPASVLLPRIVGERRALGLLLSGDTITAAEAERLGLVNAVFAADRLQDEVARRTQQLLELSGCALRLAKRAVRATRGLGETEAHRKLERLYLDELMRTRDADEGLRSFLEKRRPDWTHA